MLPLVLAVALLACRLSPGALAASPSPPGPPAPSTAPVAIQQVYKSVADFLDQNAKDYKVVIAAFRTVRTARAQPNWLDFNGTFFLPNDAVGTKPCDSWCI